MLATGRFSWVDPDTGEELVTHEEWHIRWAIAGWPSYSWWWVRKFGKRDCGCTINPITRRRVLIAMECPDHGRGVDWLSDALDDVEFD